MSANPIARVHGSYPVWFVFIVSLFFTEIGRRHNRVCTISAVAPVSDDQYGILTAGVCLSPSPPMFPRWRCAVTYSCRSPCSSCCWPRSYRPRPWPCRCSESTCCSPWSWCPCRSAWPWSCWTFISGEPIACGWSRTTGGRCVGNNDGRVLSPGRRPRTPCRHGCAPCSCTWCRKYWWCAVLRIRWWPMTGSKARPVTSTNWITGERFRPAVATNPKSPGTVVSWSKKKKEHFTSSYFEFPSHYRRANVSPFLSKAIRPSPSQSGFTFSTSFSTRRRSDATCSY